MNQIFNRRNDGIETDSASQVDWMNYFSRIELDNDLKKKQPKKKKKKKKKKKIAPSSGNRK